MNITLGNYNHYIRNMTTVQAVVDYQTKRFGKPPGTYTAEQLGLSNIIGKGNNLYDLLANGRLKLMDCTSHGKDEIKFQFYNPSDQILATIKGATLLTPAQIEKNKQTLLVKKDYQLKVKNGQSQHSVETFCHDMDRPAPHKQKFFLPSIKNVHYRQGMSQNEVWQITVKNGKLKPVQEWANQNQNLIMIKKKDLIAIISLWED